MTPQDRSTRARVAAATRHHPDAPETVELARDFKADRLAEAMERALEAAPPLTPTQLARLQVLLSPPAAR